MRNARRLPGSRDQATRVSIARHVVVRVGTVDATPEPARVAGPRSFSESRSPDARSELSALSVPPSPQCQAAFHPWSSPPSLVPAWVEAEMGSKICIRTVMWECSP